MKNYIVTDRLNPNAISPKYGRPRNLCGVDVVVCEFSAASDDEAIEKASKIVETLPIDRVSPKLWRSKEWYGGRETPVYKGI